MHALKTTGPFLLIVAMFVSCSKPTESIIQDRQPTTQKTIIPDFIIAKSDSFIIPAKPWIGELAEFAVDSVGNLITEIEPSGIPECLSLPSCCVFEIDSAAAVAIARQAGLEDGMGPWRMDFHWYGNVDNSVWTVSNTLSGQVEKTMVIDSYSGVVIETTFWVIVS